MGEASLTLPLTFMMRIMTVLLVTKSLLNSSRTSLWEQSTSTEMIMKNEEDGELETPNEATKLPFPNCAAGLVCKDQSDINILGADKVCVPEGVDDVRVSENQF